MSERDDFQQWENETDGNQSPEFVVFRQSLELARGFQEGMFQQDATIQEELGRQALEMLSELQEDVHGKQFYMHVMGAMAIFSAPRFRPHALQYGEMIIGGSVGTYGLSVRGNAHTLMLQVYEPQQKKVWDERDVIQGRLPVPLSVPVASVESIFSAK